MKIQVQIDVSYIFGTNLRRFATSMINVEGISISKSESIVRLMREEKVDIIAVQYCGVSSSF
jgi:hypothetical protein